MAIVAPAFPQAGRFTKNGHQFLNDTPLELTEIWRSEGIPGTAHIPGMLARHGINTESVGIAEIRQGTDHLRAVLESCANNGVQAVVCDVETDDDLRVIAQASVSLGRLRGAGKPLVRGGVWCRQPGSDRSLMSGRIDPDRGWQFVERIAGPSAIPVRPWGDGAY
jgi:uncharacterized protein YgbK (DUF1537 family)